MDDPFNFMLYVLHDGLTVTDDGFNDSMFIEQSNIGQSNHFIYPALAPNHAIKPVPVFNGSCVRCGCMYAGSDAFVYVRTQTVIETAGYPVGTTESSAPIRTSVVSTLRCGMYSSMTSGSFV